MARTTLHALLALSTLLAPSLTAQMPDSPARPGAAEALRRTSAHPRARPDFSATPPASPSGGAGSISSRSAGVHEVDGALVGGGPDYGVRFLAAGIELKAAFGSTAPESPPLRIRVEGARRGRAELGFEPAAPLREGSRVRFPRGAMVEQYDVRLDGVEQSFLFSSKPGGEGDLVVRARIDTRLAPTRTGDVSDGFAFELAGHGSITVGAVTGVDARGETVRGSMRFDGTWLEMSLPHAFVEDASYPLILDPLFGTELVVASSFDEADPNVAFDATHEVYLVAWERWFAADDPAIRAQRVDLLGNLVGGTIFIHDNANFTVDPSVANVRMREQFVVAWREGGNVRCRAVDAADGSLENSITVAGTGDTEIDPQIGGESGPDGDAAILVWLTLPGLGPTADIEIRAARIAVNEDGFVSISDTATLASGFNDGCPAISRHGGEDGRYLVTWDRVFSTSDPEIRGAVVSRDLTVLDSFVSITSNTLRDGTPAVDGDGSSWLVAFEQEDEFLSGDRDIVCRRVVYDPGTGSASAVGPEVVIEGDLNDDEAQPSVAYLGDSYLIGYIDATAGFDYDGYVVSVDPFTALDCEGEIPIALGANGFEHIEIAGTRSAAPGVSPRALIVWEDRGDPVDGDILAWRYNDQTSPETDLGGGCGQGGVASVPCAMFGNANFAHRLTGAAPNAPAFLVMSLDSIGEACSPCELLPNPFTGVVLNAGVTDGLGSASYAMPIPPGDGLFGLKVIEQWAVVVPAPTCAGLGVDLSNAVSIPIF